MKKDKKVRESRERRDFLKLAALGAATGVAVAAGGKPATASEATPEGAGYRETEHVRKYYKSARF